MATGSVDGATGLQDAAGYGMIDHVRQGGVIWGVVEVAIGQAAMVAISVGTTSIVVGMSSAMASVCM